MPVYMFLKIKKFEDILEVKKQIKTFIKKLGINDFEEMNQGKLELMLIKEKSKSS